VELTARQRQLAFALIVVLLAALGIYLLRSHGHAHPGAHATSPPASTPAAASSGTTAPATPAATTAPPPASSAVNIYRWLPFTQQDLASAARVVTAFSARYGTYSYRLTTAAYTSRLAGLATSQLAQVIGGGYATPGVAKLRQQQRQVSAASAVIDSLRAFGSSSLTFVVTVNQRITQAGGAKQQSTRYAVTASGGGTGWQVSDIELASAGNQ
jgi:hypothetical protein